MQGINKWRPLRWSRDNPKKPRLASRACMEDEPQEVGLRRQPWLPPTALYTPLARGTDFSKV